MNSTDSSSLTPQQWWEVTAPPADIASDVAAMMPHDGELSTRELATLVTGIVARPELWKPLVVTDAQRRRYRLMYDDERIDVWVLSWMPGQGTGFHDHDQSGVGLACADGVVSERQMKLPSGVSCVQMRPGDVRMGGAGYIHAVEHAEGLPAVTIHAYSPTLVRVGQYRVDDAGILRRTTEHGRQELLDHSIDQVLDAT